MSLLSYLCNTLKITTVNANAMKREEEINDAIGGFGLWSVGEAMFKLGAEWADEHPRKNLVDIDKAVKWIKDNANKFVYVSAHTNTASINEHLFAEEFAEAMSNNDVVDACDTCKDNQYCSKSNYVKSHCYKR